MPGIRKRNAAAGAFRRISVANRRVRVRYDVRDGPSVDDRDPEPVPADERPPCIEELMVMVRTIRGVCPLDRPCGWLVTINTDEAMALRDGRADIVLPATTVDERDANMDGGAVYYGTRA
jgi:hypothetical protein